MTPAKPPVVLVVEDSATMRHAIRDFIALSWPALEIREAADGGSALAALEALEAHQPAFALVDIQLPDISGIEVIRAATARRPGAAVFAMSIARQKHLIDGALAAGATSFIDKEKIFSELPVLIGRMLEHTGTIGTSGTSAIPAARPGQAAARPADAGISDTANRPSPSDT